MIKSVYRCPSPRRIGDIPIEDPNRWSFRAISLFAKCPQPLRPARQHAPHVRHGRYIPIEPRFSTWSPATEAFDAARSDIDFVVDFEELRDQGLFKRYFGLKEELEALFGRPVDLVMADAMKNPFFIESVNRTRQPVYASLVPQAT